MYLWSEGGGNGVVIVIFINYFSGCVGYFLFSWF